MIKFLQNIFRIKPSDPLAELRAKEDKISATLSATDLPRKKFSESQEREGEHRKALNELSIANPDLQITSKSVENEAAAKRLKRRKWFTVLVEAVLAVSAVRLFLGETINIHNLPLLTTILFGLVIAYAVLDVAINFRIDDSKITSNGIMSLWYRYSWLLPLLLIPFLNVFQVLSHPGNSTNIVWLFFAVLSVWLNIKCAGYSKQFELMKNTAIAERKSKPHETGLKKERDIQQTISDKMISVKGQMVKLAADFERLYMSFESKPKLTLHPMYCMLLNNRFYLMQMLPIPEIVIMNPPKNMSGFLDFWDATTQIPVSVNNAAQSLQETEEQGSPQIATAPQPETVKHPVERAQSTESNTAEQGATNTAAPDFGEVLSNEDEIFV